MAVEIERKFTISPGERVPDLAEVVRSGESRRFSLKAVYFDTPNLELARNRITLRRRTGGSDAGWHLKLPGDGHARQEIHEPIVRGASTLQVPAALREQVAELIGYAPLVPVVELKTARNETDLTTRRGRKLAILCDDTVTATRNGHKQKWRELEVELDGGTTDDLEAITATLSAAGVRPSKSVSKLVQAMGDRLREAEDERLTRKSSAAAVIRAYVAAQVGAIQGREADARVDAPDAVHKMRVATRRLRSTLRTFRPLLDTERTEPIRAELKWLGQVLGEPRDAEVMRDRIRAAIEELPAGAVLGPVSERVTAELDATHADAHRALVEALESPRYTRLLDDLVGLFVTSPFTEYADARAKGVLPPVLDDATKRVTRRWKAAQAADGEEQIVQWHETRKRAKAARYAWEAVAPAFATAADAAKAWEEVTESLGTAQDTVVARERLLELARAAADAGEPTFTYGVLWEREEASRLAATDTAKRAIRTARKASAI
ncbi:CYTH and CHAD domain-containing protein [Mariniluteicoccus endophyticus]